MILAVYFASVPEELQVPALLFCLGILLATLFQK